MKPRPPRPRRTPRWRATLPLDDPTDLELATRGRIAPLAGPVLRDDGGTAWDPGAGGFLAEDPPPEANPSLWRQARLNAEHGLFEVCDGVFQVRGADVSNITFVRRRDRLDRGGRRSPRRRPRPPHSPWSPSTWASAR